MKTRSEIIFQWSVYSAVSLLVLLVQKLLLPQLQLFGVSLFLPPMIAAMLSAFEPGAEGMLFSLFFGVLCDWALIGPVPCFYTVTFVLAAILAGLISGRMLSGQLLCSITVSAAAYLTGTLLRWVLMASDGVGLLTVLLYGGKELLLALPFVVPLHFLYAFFYHRFHFYD